MTYVAYVSDNIFCKRCHFCLLCRTGLSLSSAGLAGLELKIAGKIYFHLSTQTDTEARAEIPKVEPHNTVDQRHFHILRHYTVQGCHISRPSLKCCDCGSSREVNVLRCVRLRERGSWLRRNLCELLMGQKLTTWPCMAAYTRRKDLGVYLAWHGVRCCIVGVANSEALHSPHYLIRGSFEIMGLFPVVVTYLPLWVNLTET